MDMDSHVLPGMQKEAARRVDAILSSTLEAAGRIALPVTRGSILFNG
jgi:hypothetical protein